MKYVIKKGKQCVSSTEDCWLVFAPGSLSPYPFSSWQAAIDFIDFVFSIERAANGL